MVHPDLIYDVGLFGGEDTAYYLFCGYRVVALDANPLMIERARARFAREVQDGRLALLNVGISNGPECQPFWISERSEWSSFNRAVAARDGTLHAPVSVPVVPFAQVLEQHGVPHYLKIDIEGNDRLCVDALRGRTLPRYISVESECVGDSEALSDEQATAILLALREVGYRRFKLVDQRRGWIPVRPDGAARLWTRVVDKTAKGGFRLGRLSRFARRFTDASRVGALGFNFSFGSSGPWGEGLPGGWMSFEKARATYLRERRAFVARARTGHEFWYDWHATY
jgi:FkbM family methyltransferase